ncbi:hypothetical protein Sjap_002519 [Stephania japonica]|uniref:Choline transporter-like protein n=1 Tax=Stephania japonica TaxID=461633 RepID=A0AAP0KPC2_9MAGN
MARIKHDHDDSRCTTTTTHHQVPMPIQIDHPADSVIDDQPKIPRIRSSSNTKISPINNKEHEEVVMNNNHQPGHHHDHDERIMINGSDLFLVLFITQILAITVLTISLTIYTFMISPSHHRRPSFHPLHFYPPLLTSSAFSSLFAFAAQSSLSSRLSTLSYSSKLRRPIVAAFFLAPLSLLSFAILLLAIGSAASFAVAALAIVASSILALYSCWAAPRVPHAAKLISSSALSSTDESNSTRRASSTKLALSVALLVATAHSLLIVCAIAAATASRIGVQFRTSFFLAILLSLAWTMHVLRGLVHVHFAGIAFNCFTNNSQNTTVSARWSWWSTELLGVLCPSRACVGSVCIGAVVEPAIGAVRGAARAVGVVGGERDEFMFSCESWCSGVGREVVRYGNRWGYVGFGVSNKGFVGASMEAWGMFEMRGMVRLIDKDLTGAICFMWGVTGGSLCALLGGSWALAVDRSYAFAVAVYAFLIGYFMARIGMARPQACVSAYHVAYAEDSNNPRFDSTIPERMQELQRSQV